MTYKIGDRAAMEDVKALIMFYERRKRNWLLAAEFRLAHHAGDYPAPRCGHKCGHCSRREKEKP